MNTPFTGGCVCGAIRYECTAQPTEIQMFKCHCRDCQRVGGGAFSAVVYVPAPTFKITRGKVHYHHTPSEFQGEHKRGYCADCGSRLTGGEGPKAPGVGMMVASLDDPSWFRPAMHMWISDAQPWDILEPDIPKFEKLPPVA